MRLNVVQFTAYVRLSILSFHFQNGSAPGRGLLFYILQSIMIYGVDKESPKVERYNSKSL